MSAHGFGFLARESHYLEFVDFLVWQDEWPASRVRRPAILRWRLPNAPHSNHRDRDDEMAFNGRCKRQLIVAQSIKFSDRTPRTTKCRSFVAVNTPEALNQLIEIIWAIRRAWLLIAGIRRDFVQLRHDESPRVLDPIEHDLRFRDIECNLESIRERVLFAELVGDRGHPLCA